MTDKEKLYETLGELLYAVAKADGVLRTEEKEELDKLLANHPWSSQIKWSFDYEANKETSVDELYDKVINFCHGYGPEPEYVEFIDAMKIIANAPGWVHEKQSEMIHSFSEDLIERFQRDMDKLL